MPPSKVNVGIVLEDYTSSKYPFIIYYLNEEVLVLESYENYYLVEKNSGVQGFIPKDLISIMQ